ncbi:MAG: tyrosine--tRNA ligase [bacterium]|nr:tyrosine--tRNA ligase [bacterium]
MSDVNLLLNNGIENIYPSKEFLTNLLLGQKKLKVYFGVDPTGEMQLHHTVPLRKLRQFQDLGHKVVLLIGSFTAMIGDPTGKSKTRVPLTHEQVLENSSNYTKYANKILDTVKNPYEVVYNHDWLEKLTFVEIIKLSSNFTVSQMIERDMFQERLKNNLPIGLHEFLYPLMQGYDSVVLDVDVEIGGTDQTFNMLAGRKLVENYLNKEKCVVTTPLLTDSNGKKTSTSDGTGIPLNLSANDTYGKVMSLPDTLMLNIFKLCTRFTVDEVVKLELRLNDGENPIIIKKILAYEVVSLFHGDEDACLARENFEKTVQHKELPHDIPERIMESGGRMDVSDLLLATELVDSKSDARRMITQNAVSYFIDDNEVLVTEIHMNIDIKNGMILKLGKRRFLRLIVS